MGPSGGEVSSCAFSDPVVLFVNAVIIVISEALTDTSGLRLVFNNVILAPGAVYLLSAYRKLMVSVPI